MIVVYLAGPYTADTPEGIAANIAVARKVAIELWEKGFAVICPHLNTAHFEVDCQCEYLDYVNGDLAIVERVDAVVLLPGWRSSPGARVECDVAHMRGIEVTEYPELPTKSTN